MSALILLGSARSDGLTAEAAARLAQAIGNGAELIDLLRLHIAPFRYGHASTDDDFSGLIERMLAHQTLVFATPVYWYAMSGVMKTLFDRFTDLLGPEGAGSKARAMAGRRTRLLSTGTEGAAPDGFNVPFERTSDYLGMVWRGACYVQVGPSTPLGEAASEAIARFADEILADKKRRPRRTAPELREASRRQKRCA